MEWCMCEGDITTSLRHYLTYSKLEHKVQRTIAYAERMADSDFGIKQDRYVWSAYTNWECL